MGWQFFLLISILAESFGRVFQRFLLKGDQSNPVAYLVWFQFISGCFLLVITFFHGFKLPNDPISILPNLLLLPILYGTAGSLIFRALQLIEASVFTILFNARAIIVVLGAVFFLKNPFTLIQLLGTILILAGVVTVSFQKQSMSFKKGEIFTLIAGLCIALGALNDSIIINKFDPYTFTTYGFFAPMIFVLLLNFKSAKQILAFPKTKTFPKVFILSALFSTAFLSYNLAFLSGRNAAQIAAIFPFSSVLTVLISVILLKERQKLPLKIIAAMISFLGVILIS